MRLVVNEGMTSAVLVDEYEYEYGGLQQGAVL
jgi:hypothetical protein